jgi:hypothetical protein
MLAALRRVLIASQYRPGVLVAPRSRKSWSAGSMDRSRRLNRKTQVPLMVVG